MVDRVSLKKNAILNVTKQVLYVAFPLITFPYVSRVLHEANLGKYNFTLSLISYFCVIATLGINVYAVREGARIREDKEKLTTFASQIFTINILTTAISYIALFILYLLWPKLHDYKELLLIQSLAIFAPTMGVDWINSIFEDFEYMTKRYVFVKMVGLIAIFLFVKEENDYILYSAINTGIEILASTMNVIYVRKYLHLHLTRDFKLNIHLRPMLVLFTNSLAITLCTNTDVIMLGIFKTDSVVGIYSVASKVFQIAKKLVSAIVVVAIPRMAALLGEDREKDYVNLIGKTIKTICLFMLPMIMGIIVLSREIMFFLGGSSFVSGTGALQILGLALIPVCISGVFFDGVLIVSRQENKCFQITVISAATNILLNFVLLPTFGILGTVSTTLIAEVINCILSLWYTRDVFSIRSIFDKDMTGVLLGSGIVLAMGLLLKGGFRGYIYAICYVIASVIVYLIVQLIFKNTVLFSLLHTVKNLKNRKR